MYAEENTGGGVVCVCVEGVSVCAFYVDVKLL